MPKVKNYKAVVSDNEGNALLAVNSTNRHWIGCLAKIAKENALNCVITVPATTIEKVVKIAGL